MGRNGNLVADWMNLASVGVIQVTCSNGKSQPYGMPEDILSRDQQSVNCHMNDDKSVRAEQTETFFIDLPVFISDVLGLLLTWCNKINLRPVQDPQSIHYNRTSVTGLRPQAKTHLAGTHTVQRTVQQTAPQGQ